MDPFSKVAPQVGEILEQGKHVAADGAKTAVSDTVASVQGQLGIKNEKNVNSSSNPLSQIVGSPSGQATQLEPSTGSTDANLNNEQTQEMVKDYYAPSGQINGQPAPNTQEEVETAAKLKKLREELHQQMYYDPLFAYEHKKQERPADVAEKEDEQKKMMELEQEKQDKKLPLAVQRAQTSVEINRGVSG